MRYSTAPAKLNEASELATNVENKSSDSTKEEFFQVTGFYVYNLSEYKDRFKMPTGPRQPHLRTKFTAMEHDTPPGGGGGTYTL